MSDLSNESKQRWNAAHYTHMKFNKKLGIASVFKAACADVSMTGVISGFMVNYCSLCH